MIRKYLAKRRLARDVRRRKAMMADYARNRAAQLSSARKAHIRDMLNEQR